MSSLPAELSSFVTFFRLTHLIDNNTLLEYLCRLHAYLMTAVNRTRNHQFEGHFLDDKPFSAAYLQPVSTDKSKFLQIPEALNKCSDFRFTIDQSGNLKINYLEKPIDPSPFIILRQGAPFWLKHSKPGSFTYQDGGGNTFTSEQGQSLFEELIDGFLNIGWYRVILQVMEGVPENRRKSFENKIYSAHCFLACDYYKMKRYAEAVAEFEKAMRIKSNMPQLFYNLALSYARLNSPQNGIWLLNQLNRIKPNQPKTFELLGDLYFHLGEWERSFVLYKRALEFSDNKGNINSKIKKLDDKLPKGKAGDPKKEDEKDERFSISSCLQDLTLEAELGNLQPVLGREKEILQMQEILACQSKKNVLILGEPGVGKTALVYELAYRIASGKVNPRLLNKKLIRVSMGSLLAGAKFRGQFEERLLQLIREAKRTNCILFLDDVHQIVSGGGMKSTSMEASHFLKPALLNDEIQVIGATNFEEFRNTIEKDNSFLRCFQLIRLEEPDAETLIQIMRAYRNSLESYHHVIINEESLETTLMWVKVLLRDRALPDKALDVLDRASARISIQEKSAIVSSESILETISEISNVPLSRMSVSERVHYRNIESFLSGRVAGQPQAINTVSKVLCTSKLRMNLNPIRPKGIFLFVGPTGVGKTELAKAMAQFLFGHEDKVIRIDMSEYMERYSASRLIGTSPGYVGYYDQNQLVDKIRSNPYSLILLDEIEKADPQLLSIFLQVFDAGRLTDGKGKIAYFDNTTIVMTSNAGTHLFAQNKLGYGSEQEFKVTRSDLMKEVKRFFQPEFLNRIDEIVFFHPLSMDDVRQIAHMKLSTIFDQLKKQGKDLVIQEEAMLQLCKIGYDYEYGARNLERVLRRHILDRLAALALSDEWQSIHTINVDWQDDAFVLKTGAAKFHEELDPGLEEQSYLEE